MAMRKQFAIHKQTDQVLGLLYHNCIEKHLQYIRQLAGTAGTIKCSF